MENKGKQEIKENQICYFIDNNRWSTLVSYGVFVGRNIISGNYHISRLKPWETRIINGVPFDKFKSETKFKKLPKDYTYQKDLWEESIDDKKVKLFNANAKNKNAAKPEDLQWLYDNGFLVKKKNVEPVIEDEIDHGFYRVIKKYPAWTQVYGSHNDVYVTEIFATYEEATKRLNELKEISHRESVFISWLDFYETLDWLMDKYEADYGGKNLEKIRQKILSRPHLNDTIFRYYKGEILAMSRSDYRKNCKNWEKVV